ncbi:MAG: hypothetical protein Q9169_004109, partial [Polycauliona sp. 2 TL-2023]
MYSLNISVFAAIALLSQTYLTSAQTRCEFDPDRASRYSANATGSVIKPLYVPLPSSRIPAGNWTWSTAVDIRENVPWRTIALDTSTLGGIPEEDIPFHVCISMYSNLHRETYIVNGQRPSEGNGREEGDCTSILNRDCIDRMTTLAKEAAANGDVDCERLFDIDTPEECEEDFYWEGNYFSLFTDKQLYTPVTLTPNELTNSTPGSDNYEASADLFTCDDEQNNETIHRFNDFAVAAGDSLESTTLDETLYDEMLYQIVPFLTTIVSDDDSPQASFVCVRASDVADGSRVPPEIPQHSPPPAPGVVLDGSNPQAGIG